MLKNISNLGTALNKEDQEKITGGMFPNPFICGGTGGLRVNHSQEACIGYGYLWQHGACYICY
jgi:hypothetical protein